MNHWREVASEQLRLLAIGCPGATVRVGFSGNNDEFGYLARTADAHGVSLDCLFCGSGDHNYEFPTLDRLDTACRVETSRSAVLYFHTKGVSRPGEWRSVMWRWFLNAYMLRGLLVAMDSLASASVVAPVFSSEPMLHPCGNFWLARTDHVCDLPKLDEFKATFMSRFNEKRPQWLSIRHAAEMWICQNSPLIHALHQDPDSNISCRDFWCRRADMQDFVTRYGA